MGEIRARADAGAAGGFSVVDLFHTEEADVRRQLTSQIFTRRRETKTRGDELVANYDSEGGETLNREMETVIAGAIASSFKGSPEQLCQRVRRRVPSAKPCRMNARKGMKSPNTQQQLRTGDLDGWGSKRLLAVAAALGAKGIRVELVW